MTPRSFGTAVLLHAFALAILAQGIVVPRGNALPTGTVGVSLSKAIAHDHLDRPPELEQEPLSQPEAHTSELIERLETPLVVELPPLPPEPEPPEEVKQRIETLPSPPPRRSGRLPTRASPVHPATEEAPTAQEARPAPAPAGGDNQEISPDQKPRIIDPQWPRSVRRRFTGSVVVDVSVTADGRATDVEMVEGTGNADFDEALCETFADTRYIPASAGGVPVACKHRFRVTIRRE
jgi:protein TonB